MGISTHILDTARGKPAQGVEVTVAVGEGGAFRELARGVTNADGRVKPLLETISTPGVSTAWSSRWSRTLQDWE
jgi:5-hydroxyisourate hydrolase